MLDQAFFSHTFSHEGKFENIQKPEFIENYLSFFQGLCSKTGRKSGFFDLSFLKIGENLSFFRPEFFWEWGKKKPGIGLLANIIFRTVTILLNKSVRQKTVVLK